MHMDEELEEYKGKLVSLDFQEAEIGPIIMLLARDMGGMNVVLHPQVKGTITLDLKDVPWDLALDIILKQCGLDQRVKGNIMRVAPVKVFWAQDKVYKITSERRNMFAEETVIETSIEDLIAECESSGLEFKSSLRWSYDKSKIDKSLQQVIMKAIAAFANSKEGGTLLIGLNNDGKILGLGQDYISLKGNADKFELHLRSLINKTFGRSFAASNINVMFHVIDEKEICQVDIKKSKIPQYMEIPDNKGIKTKKFFVRSGNQSIDLPLVEAVSYIKNNFE